MPAYHTRHQETLARILARSAELEVAPSEILAGILVCIVRLKIAPSAANAPFVPTGMRAINSAHTAADTTESVASFRASSAEPTDDFDGIVSGEDSENDHQDDIKHQYLLNLETCK